jgi:metallo-beta-lactamase family protein
MIQGHDHFPVFVDSPLAVEATKVFHENLTECFDDETKALVEKGINPIMFDDLTLSITTDDSTAINFNPTPKIILAAAGMCNAGRIRHHLKHNLWRPECSVVFAGYQAEGTLGRSLQDGIERVKLFGEEIAVRAHIETMRDMSSHADKNGLISWASSFGDLNGRGRIFLVHGDDEAMKSLSEKLRETTGNKVDCPYSGSVFDLTANEWITVAEPVLFRKETAVHIRNDALTGDLFDAMTELKAIVERTAEGANADKKKLAEAIRKLAAKYGFQDELNTKKE